MKLNKKDLIPYIFVGSAIAVAVFALGMSRSNGVMRSVCDGLFVAGAALVGVGGIKWVVNRGVFDTVGYGLKSTFHIHFPASRDLRDREDFSEYRERKEKSRRPAKPMLIVAFAFLAASLIALLIYYAI